MKKSIFFLLAVMMTISFTSCYDDIYPNVSAVSYTQFTLSKKRDGYSSVVAGDL